MIVLVDVKLHLTTFNILSDKIYKKILTRLLHYNTMYATEGCKNGENLSYKLNNESNINFHHSIQQGIGSPSLGNA